MKKSFIVKILAGVFAVSAVSAGAVAIVQSRRPTPTPPEITAGHTVAVQPPTDDSLPTAHTGLENVSYMAYNLQHESTYHISSASTVTTSVGFFSYEQQVETYKDYRDGVMVVEDIAKSSLVNKAMQTCFVSDRALWRAPASSAAKDWDGQNTAWKEAEPANYSVTEYMGEYGLPCTEFSVYILNESTVTRWSDVVDNGDGTYSQTIYPDIKTAGQYYTRRMKTMGGLTEYPTFNNIGITYTFDGDWKVLSSVTEENYAITMSVITSDDCRAVTQQTYSYKDKDVDISAYDTFFSRYVEKQSGGTIGDLPDGEATAIEYLSAAFAPVLTGPVQFEAELALDGKTLDGRIYADVTDLQSPELRAELAGVYIWYTDGRIYVREENNFCYLTAQYAQELLASFGFDVAVDFGSFPDVDELLSQLSEGELTVGENEATLAVNLEISSVRLPLIFSFQKDGKDISLHYVTLNGMQAGDALLSARLAFDGGERLPALTDGEKQSAVGLEGYIDSALQFVQSQYFGLTLSYAAENAAVDISATLDTVNFTLSGEFSLAYEAYALSGSFVYADEYLYCTLDRGESVPVRISVSTAKVGEYLGNIFPEEEIAAAVGNIFENLSSVAWKDVVTSFVIADENVELKVDADSLFDALNADMGIALGEVTLQYTPAGVLSLGTTGANLTLQACEAREITIKASEYTDITPLFGYIDGTKELIGAEALAVSLHYTAEEFSIYADFTLNLADTTAAGTVYLYYGEIAVKADVFYRDGYVYLRIARSGEDLRVKLELAELLNFLTDEVFVSAAEELSLDIDWDGVLRSLKITEKNVTVSLPLGINGTSLTADVQYTPAGVIAVRAMGAEIEARACGAAAVRFNERLYTDVTPWLNGVDGAIELIQSKYFAFRVAYATEELSVTLNGTLDMQEKTVSGEFVLAYGGTDYTGTFAYRDKFLYLTLNRTKGESLKVYVDIDTLVQSLGMDLSDLGTLIGGLVGMIEIDVNEAFSSLTVMQNGLTLSLPVDIMGSRLTVLNIGYDTVGARLSVDVAGASVDVQKGEKKPVQINEEQYTDITSYLPSLITLLTNGQADITGWVEIQLDNLDVFLQLTKVNVSWSDGFALYAKAQLEVAGTLHDVQLLYQNGDLSVVYGKIGVKVKADEFDSLAQAFENVYEKIAAYYAPAVKEGGEAAEEVLGLTALSALFSADEINSVLNSIKFNTDEEGALTVALTVLTMDIDIACRDGAFCVRANGGLSDQCKIGVELNVSDGWRMGKLPKNINYITAAQLQDFCDYVIEVFEAATQTEWNLDYTMTVYNADEAYAPYGGVQYGVSGKVQIALADEEAEKAFAAALDLAIVSTNPAERSYYINFTVSDGWLYIVVSYYNDAENENYNPLYLKGELSELANVFGTFKTVLGYDLSFLEDILSPFLPVVEKQPSVTQKIVVSDMIQSLTMGKDGIELTLNTDLIYQKEGLENVVLSLSRAAESGYLTAAAKNLYYKTEPQAWLDMAFVLLDEPCDVTAPEGTFIDISTVDGLLNSLLDSFLTVSDGKMDVLDGYYFAGQITVSVAGFKLNFDVTANACLSDGEIVVNATIASGSKFLINGGAYKTWLTLDVKQGMIYMMREQYEYYSGISRKKYNPPVVTYRSMTLEEFGADYWEQIVYMTNMGSTVANAVKNAMGNPSTGIDYKKDVGTYLKAYSYENNTYQAVLNGQNFAEILGDMKVTIVCNDEGKITDISLGVKISVDINIDLKYENVTKTDGNYSLTMKSLLSEWLESGRLPALEREGYSFLGWWYQTEEGDWQQVTDLSILPASAVVKPMWFSAAVDITANATVSGKTVTAEVTGVEQQIYISPEVSEQVLTRLESSETFTYTFKGKKKVLWTTGDDTATETTSARIASHTFGVSATSASVAVTVTYTLNGVTVATATGAWNS